jgi:aminomethyltransferase
MGYPLHGHELSLEITPVQAGSTWAVGWKKEEFRGSQALRAEKESGATRILRGLQSTDRGIPRAGMEVKSSDGAVIGVITSGTFSPSLKKGIALALLKPEYVIGDSVVVDVRGRDSVAEIVALPMVESHVR